MPLKSWNVYDNIKFYNDLKNASGATTYWAVHFIMQMMYVSLSETQQRPAPGVVLVCVLVSVCDFVLVSVCCLCVLACVCVLVSCMCDFIYVVVCFCCCLCACVYFVLVCVSVLVVCLCIIQHPTPGAVLVPCMATTDKNLLSAYFSPYMARQPICNASSLPCQIRYCLRISCFLWRSKKYFT